MANKREEYEEDGEHVPWSEIWIPPPTADVLGVMCHDENQDDGSVNFGVYSRVISLGEWISIRVELMVIGPENDIKTGGCDEAGWFVNIWAVPTEKLQQHHGGDELKVSGEYDPVDSAEIANRALYTELAKLKSILEIELSGVMGKK